MSFIQTILDKLGNIQVNNSLCVDLISPKGHCKFCVDNCPIDAISFENENIIIKDNCNGCGICTSNCKPKALTKINPTEKGLINAIKSGNIDKFDCNIDSEDERMCAGALSKEIITYIYINDSEFFSNINEDKCDTCKFNVGYQLFNKRITEIENSFKDYDSLHLIKEKSDVDLNKREFLKNIFRLPSKRLDNSIKNYHEYYSELVNENPEITQHIDFLLPAKSDNKCSKCQACVKLCPTDALDMKQDNMYLNKSLCCGCGLCANVCFEKALTVQKNDGVIDGIIPIFEEFE
ncbi:4Fe-4S binding protein [Finegoldia magna]|uniref:4Fe-4S binding protein n=1 Tax=Finegoldia magna TaxID=1260 RepID=UPI000B91BB8C|nr:4Fe-4S binding protein [Finegoldia magna]OXZ36413.1 hypothetical protein B9N54_00630 [Finegoldia magna]